MVNVGQVVIVSEPTALRETTLNPDTFGRFNTATLTIALCFRVGFTIFYYNYKHKQSRT